MSQSQFERTLLASGSHDAPSPERRNAARTAFLRAAGVSAAVGTAAIVTTELVTATTTTTTTMMTAATTSTSLTLGKVILLSALSIGVGAAGASVIASSSSSSSSSSPSLPSATLRLSPSSSLSASASSEHKIPVIAVGAMPNATEAPAPRSTEPSIAAPAVALAPSSRAFATQTPSPISSKHMHETPDEDPLATEARLLEAARACLATSDRACARARLAEHDKRFAKNSALADERTVLAIDLALADGNATEARRLAKELLAAKPHGTWSSRVRRLAEEDVERHP